MLKKIVDNIGYRVTEEYPILPTAEAQVVNADSAKEPDANPIFPRAYRIEARVSLEASCIGRLDRIDRHKKDLADSIVREVYGEIERRLRSLERELKVEGHGILTNNYKSSTILKDLIRDMTP